MKHTPPARSTNWRNTISAAYVQQHLPRNAQAYLIHGMLGMTGFRLVTAPTFVPAYIYLLSGSKLVVGCVLSAQYAGMAMSSIWGATQIEHRQRVMPLIYLVGWLVRLQILGLGLSAFLLSGDGALTAAAVFLLLFGLFNGVQNVTFNYLTSKIIPLERRGMLSALRNFLGGLIAAAVAYLGGRFLVGGNVFGNGYATTFPGGVRPHQPGHLRADADARTGIARCTVAVRLSPAHPRSPLPCCARTSTMCASSSPGRWWRSA
ncbi:hypothetical protein ACU4GD_04845 [Cupriavidus basilensis]